MAFFTWLEHSGFAVTIKESAALYELPLVLHAIGMAVLVGLSVAVYLRILGVAPHVPLGPMEKFFPIMFVGFWVNALSGLVLFSLYPVKALTNPGFFIKMGGVVLAVLLLRRIKQQVFGDSANLGTRPVPARGKAMAAIAIVVWLVTITAGRLMAYHNITGVERQSSLAVAIASMVLLLAGYAVIRGGDSSTPVHADTWFYRLVKGR